MSRAELNVSVNGVTYLALPDPGSSLSFINCDVVTTNRQVATQQVGCPPIGRCCVDGLNSPDSHCAVTLCHADGGEETHLQGHQSGSNAGSVCWHDPWAQCPSAVWKCCHFIWWTSFQYDHNSHQGLQASSNKVTMTHKQWWMNNCFIGASCPNKTIFKKVQWTMICWYWFTSSMVILWGRDYRQE